MTRICAAAFSLMILLAGCSAPKQEAKQEDLACRCLTKADLEAAIPGGAFADGKPSAENKEDGSKMQQCHFSAKDGKVNPNIYIDLFTENPPPMTIETLRQQAVDFKRDDIRPIAGVGDGAMWSVRPARKGEKIELPAVFELRVISKGHKFFNLNASGIPAEGAEPALKKLAAVVIERYQAIPRKP